MGVLTLSDYKELRSEIFRGDSKAALKSLPNLPTKAELMAAFQEIEDHWETGLAGLKADVDTAIGQTLPLNLAKYLAAVWMRWKIKQYGG